MDTIFYNGNIYTMEKGYPNCSAVAVKDGIVMRTGSDEEILALKTEGTKLVNLEGKTMVPGFGDSHMHMLSYGYSLEKVNLYSAKCVEDTIELGKKFLAERPYLTWLQGRGWNQEYWTENRFPNRYDMDKITTDIPMFYTRACGHIIVVNSKALEVMGVTKDTPQPEGGMFDLDENGEPLGIFREAARDYVYNALPELSVEDIKRMVSNGAAELVKYGITAVQTDDFEAIPAGQYQKVIDAYKQLDEEGKLGVRIFEQCLLFKPELLEKFLAEGHYTGEGTPMFRIGPLKLMADGSLGGRTAYLDRPYADDPSTCGIPVFSQETLDKLILMAQKGNMSAAVHCIGSGSAKMTMEAIEKAQLACPKADLRHAIVHCQITDEELLEKFRSLNVCALVQPAFLDDDISIVEDRVGAELAKTSYNWKTLWDKGVCVAGGSDSPVIDFNVMNGIYCGVTRKRLDGTPEGGWLPEQALSAEDWLYAYTMNSAYTCYAENVQGSIRNGKYADFAVLDTDILKADPEDIKAAKVLMTVLGGKIVYERN
ncbi:MAG: amidohydrolase [Clostridia bacterium]|nr:amidohydrolase [Clostridia bacterium]